LISLGLKLLPLIPLHLPRMLTARAISNPTIVSESTASSIMRAFAVFVSGFVSAGLRAVAPVKARNR
jgi:hypothetical protein